MATYSDFLLDRGRPAEVLALLEDHTRADALLLRLALAEQRLNHPRFAEHAALLKERFAASKARGEATHQGDEARYTLYILRQPDAALKLASGNWTLQRESRDARILLEAARDARRPGAAGAVENFLAQTRLEDARLQKLLADIRDKKNLTGLEDL